MQLLARAATLSALLSLSPALSPAQGIERGLDGDQPVVSGQRDNEDHETSLDWVGLFGVLGLVGLVGPKHKRDQRRAMTRKVLVAATILTAGALSVTTPGMAQREDDKGYTIESSQQGKGDRPPSIGWIGLLGLAGLLGLGLPKWVRRKGTHSGPPTR